MVATLGSQEGAFENVRLNYSGEQGQTIRQLVSAHMIRRVAMCCLASPGGKRQHLAVSHEKGKITVLQLSSLLKQHDSAKRKLTLTRLSSAPVPFTVLSITANPANDDFLAVCGLKVCTWKTVKSVILWYYLDMTFEKIENNINMLFSVDVNIFHTNDIGRNFCAYRSFQFIR